MRKTIFKSFTRPRLSTNLITLVKLFGTCKLRHPQLVETGPPMVAGVGGVLHVLYNVMYYLMGTGGV